MATVHKRTGSSFYHANIVVAGNRRRFSTNERNRREAQKKADEIEQRENQAAEAGASIALLAAADKFFKHKAKNRPLRPKTIEGYKSSLANIYGKLGDFRLASLTEEAIADYVMFRMEDGNNVALRNDLAFLSSLYSSAKQFDKSVRANPIQLYDKKDIPRAVEHKTWLQPKQVLAILNSCTQPYQRLFVLLATLTGMRSTEVRLLTWSEIDLDDATITLANLDATRTKNGESRIIPIPESLVVELRTAERKRNKDSDYVLINPKTKEPYTTFKTFWAGIQRRSGIKGIRIHDLRHTYASWAKQNDIDEITIMTIMGHKTRSMVKRYSHISIEHLKTSVKKLEGVRIELRPTD